MLEKTKMNIWEKCRLRFIYLLANIRGLLIHGEEWAVLSFIVAISMVISIKQTFHIDQVKNWCFDEMSENWNFFLVQKLFSTAHLMASINWFKRAGTVLTWAEVLWFVIQKRVTMWTNANGVENTIALKMSESVLTKQSKKSVLILNRTSGKLRFPTKFNFELKFTLNFIVMDSYNRFNVMYSIWLTIKRSKFNSILIIFLFHFLTKRVMFEWERTVFKIVGHDFLGEKFERNFMSYFIYTLMVMAIITMIYSAIFFDALTRIFSLLFFLIALQVNEFLCLNLLSFTNFFQSFCSVWLKSITFDMSMICSGSFIAYRISIKFIRRANPENELSIFRNAYLSPKSYSKLCPRCTYCRCSHFSRIRCTCTISNMKSLR